MSPKINNGNGCVGLLVYYAFNVSMIQSGIYWLILVFLSVQIRFYCQNQRVNDVVHWPLLVGNFRLYDVSRRRSSNASNDIAYTLKQICFMRVLMVWVILSTHDKQTLVLDDFTVINDNDWQKTTWKLLNWVHETGVCKFDFLYRRSQQMRRKPWVGRP